MSQTSDCWSTLTEAEKLLCFDPKSKAKRQLQYPTHELSAWKVTGRLAKEWNRVDREIQLRTDNIDFRSRISPGKPNRAVWHFRLYLVGKAPIATQLKPTIVAECAELNLAKKACNALKALKSNSLAPLLRAYDVHYAQIKIHLQAEPDEAAAPALPDASTRDSLCGQQIVIQPRLGSLGLLTTSTIGGAILVDGRYYALTAAHAFREQELTNHRGSRWVEGVEEREEKREVGEAEEVPKVEDVGEDAGLDTNSGSQWEGTPTEDAQLSRSTFTHHGLLYLASLVYVQKCDPTVIDSDDFIIKTQPVLGGATLLNSVSRHVLLNRTQDWALVPIENDRFTSENSFTSPTGSIARVTGITEDIPSGPVFVATGVSDPAVSSISPATSLLSLPGCEQLQIVWSASKPSASGDCGSWIIDESNRACAMVVAASDDDDNDPEIYCLPLAPIFSSIQEQMGSETQPEMPLDGVDLSRTKSSMETLSNDETSTIGPADYSSNGDQNGSIDSHATMRQEYAINDHVETPPEAGTMNESGPDPIKEEEDDIWGRFVVKGKGKKKQSRAGLDPVSELAPDDATNGHTPPGLDSSQTQRDDIQRELDLQEREDRLDRRERELNQYAHQTMQELRTRQTRRRGQREQHENPHGDRFGSRNSNGQDTRGTDDKHQDNDRFNKDIPIYEDLSSAQPSHIEFEHDAVSTTSEMQVEEVMSVQNETTNLATASKTNAQATDIGQNPANQNSSTIEPVIAQPYQEPESESRPGANSRSPERPTFVSEQRPRSESPLAFLREEYGRASAGQMVLAERQQHAPESLPQTRQRSPSSKPVRNTEKDEIIVRGRSENVEYKGPLRIRERSPREVSVDESFAYRPPRRVRTQSRVRERSRFYDERHSSAWPRTPAYSEVEREEIVFRRDDSEPPPRSRREDIIIRRDESEPPPPPPPRRERTEEFWPRRENREPPRHPPPRREQTLEFRPRREEKAPPRRPPPQREQTQEFWNPTDERAPPRRPPPRRMPTEDAWNRLDEGEQLRSRPEQSDREEVIVRRYGLGTYQPASQDWDSVEIITERYDREPPPPPTGPLLDEDQTAVENYQRRLQERMVRMGYSTFQINNIMQVGIDGTEPVMERPPPAHATTSLRQSRQTPHNTIRQDLPQLADHPYRDDDHVDLPRALLSNGESYEIRRHESDDRLLRVSPREISPRALKEAGIYFEWDEEDYFHIWMTPVSASQMRSLREKTQQSLPGTGRVDRTISSPSIGPPAKSRPQQQQQQQQHFDQGKTETPKAKLPIFPVAKPDVKNTRNQVSTDSACRILDLQFEAAVQNLFWDAELSPEVCEKLITMHQDKEAKTLARPNEDEDDDDDIDGDNENDADEEIIVIEDYEVPPPRRNVVKPKASADHADGWTEMMKDRDVSHQRRPLRR